MWERAADLAGVPRFTLMGVLGGLAARGERHSRVWELLEVERPASMWLPADFYPDALPVIDRLRARGLRVAAVGNTPAQTEELLAGPPRGARVVRAVGSREACARVLRADRLRHRATGEELAYVGDRVDNDVEPALAAGMTAVHLRRGPWGYLHEPPLEAIRIRSLEELPEALVSELRVGLGVDAHAFEDGMPLVLGGVELRRPSRARRPLRRRRRHARADRRPARRGRARRHRLALPLGRRRSAASRRSLLLRNAYGKVTAAGLELVNADCVLIGEQPRIADRRDDMRPRLAETMGGRSSASRCTPRRPTGSASPAAARACRPRPSRCSGQPGSPPRTSTSPSRSSDATASASRPSGRPRRRAAASRLGAGGTSPRTATASGAARIAARVTGTPAPAGRRRTAGSAPGRPSRRGRSAPRRRPARTRAGPLDARGGRSCRRGSTARRTRTSGSRPLCTRRRRAARSDPPASRARR